MKRPVRHQDSPRNTRKALRFAKELREELEQIDAKLNRLRIESLRYALGRIYRIENRIRAMQTMTPTKGRMKDG
jgi:hypothetical protein